MAKEIIDAITIVQGDMSIEFANKRTKDSVSMHITISDHHGDSMASIMVSSADKGTIWQFLGVSSNAFLGPDPRIP